MNTSSKRISGACLSSSLTLRQFSSLSLPCLHQLRNGRCVISCSIISCSLCCRGSCLREVLTPHAQHRPPPRFESSSRTLPPLLASISILVLERSRMSCARGFTLPPENLRSLIRVRLITHLRLRRSRTRSYVQLQYNHALPPLHRNPLAKARVLHARFLWSEYDYVSFVNDGTYGRRRPVDVSVWPHVPGNTRIHGDHHDLLHHVDRAQLLDLQVA